MKKIFLAFAFTICFTWSKAQSTDCKILFEEEGKESAYPRLSHDKSKILFQTNRSGNWQLAVIDLNDGRQIPFPADTFNNNFPDWNPDNESIAFVSDRDGNEEIYMMKSDGKDIVRITDDPGRDIHPYFSPDGKFILFNSTRGNGSFDIYRYGIQSKKTERFTNSKEDETCARYSKDMRKIIFLKNSNAGDDIFIMDTSNFLEENLTRTPAVRDGWPLPSPDGKWIYFSSLESGSFCIYRIQPDGKRKQKLTTAGDGEEDARVFISEDSRTIIYNKRAGKTIGIWRCEVTN